MQFDGDALNLSWDMTLDEVAEAAEFIKSRLEYIEEIDFEDQPRAFAVTSALFALLAAIKKSKPDIRIPLLDGGTASFEGFGTMKWVGV